MIMGQVQGKPGGTQETGCFAGSWLGPSLGCSKPWKSRRVGDQTEEQGWTPEPWGRTRIWGRTTAEGCRMKCLGCRKAEHWSSYGLLGYTSFLSCSYLNLYLLLPFNFAEAQKETWFAPTLTVSNLGCTLVCGRSKWILRQGVNIVP